MLFDDECERKHEEVKGDELDGAKEVVLIKHEHILEASGGFQDPSGLCQSIHDVE